LDFGCSSAKFGKKAKKVYLPTHGPFYLKKSTITTGGRSQLAAPSRGLLAQMSTCLTKSKELPSLATFSVTFDKELQHNKKSKRRRRGRGRRRRKEKKR
jgi:hypothetical protein